LLCGGGLALAAGTVLNNSLSDKLFNLKDFSYLKDLKYEKCKYMIKLTEYVHVY